MNINKIRTKVQAETNDHIDNILSKKLLLTNNKLWYLGLFLLLPIFICLFLFKISYVILAFILGKIFPKVFSSREAYFISSYILCWFASFKGKQY